MHDSKNVAIESKAQQATHTSHILQAQPLQTMPSDEANELSMSASTDACLPCDASQLISSLCYRNALERHQCVADQLLKLRCSASLHCVQLTCMKIKSGPYCGGHVASSAC